MQTISADTFRLLVESLPDGLFVYDTEGRLLDVNAHVCVALGYSREELLGLTVGDVARGIDKWLDAPDDMVTRFPAIALHKDGDAFPIEISLTCKIVEGRKLFLGLCHDPCGRDEETPALDLLTGLANRRRFEEELVKACFHATRTGEPVTVAMIDVDHFGLYAGDHGAARSDEALRAITAILESIARRPYDLVARRGDDSFALLLPGIDSPDTLLKRIGKELAALAIPYPGSPVAPYLTVSTGCVVALELADVAPPALLAECERALLRAKENGRNRIELIRL